MKILKSVVATRSYLEREIEWLFLSYINNRMTVLLMAIQRVRPLPVRTVLQLEFFLWDLAHHFVPPDAPRESRAAIRWLQGFVRVYPKVSPADLEKAFGMVERLYALFGLRLQLRPSRPCSAEGVRLRLAPDAA